MIFNNQLDLGELTVDYAGNPSATGLILVNLYINIPALIIHIGELHSNSTC